MSAACKNCRHWQTDKMVYGGLAAPCALDNAPWTACSFHHSCERHQPVKQEPVVAAPAQPVKPAARRPVAAPVPQNDMFAGT